MPINANKPDRWKADIARSVDFYNDWILHRAPHTFDGNLVEARKVRQAQTQWHLGLIQSWLTERGYDRLDVDTSAKLPEFPPGTFASRFTASIQSSGGSHRDQAQADVVIKPQQSASDGLPTIVLTALFSSFGESFRRRKTEVNRISKLRSAHGNDISVVLALWGYVDAGYLGCQAAEGVDWIWA
ncbi:MAG TPA: XamI family restriction endonuclease, partial [Anaerolineae bacterium]|nr:XamI family restriction endonuclease [Anaerolineae bacterium]